MSKLAAALHWAARGFRVFPLAEGTKDKPLVSHSKDATTDEAAIRAWWQDPFTGAERSHNIGISTTGMVVVDLDVNGGKQGIANFLAIGGAFDTLIAKTPRGGLHLYYDGPDSATVANLLGKNSGVDIRSHGGYVVAPGSYTKASDRSAEGHYTIELDLPVARLPQCVAGRLRAPLTRETASVNDLEETPGLIASAVDYLTSNQAPAAVQGQGGDQTTYMTACRLRDLGVTERGATALMLLHWNDRCFPPWDADELAVKVNNAYSYATGLLGQQAPEVLFSAANVPVAPPLPPLPVIDTTSMFRFGNAVEIANIPPRPWIYNRLLMRQNVTLLTAAGSAGKSTLMLSIAAHLAMGLPFLGYELKHGAALRSIIYNHEDDVDEMSRRLWALCQHYNFPYHQVRGMIALTSRKELTLRITENNPPTIHQAHAQALVDAAAAPDVGFVGVDPLVSVHTANEDDNMAMAYVMEIFHAIAEAADVAMMLAHHISKSNGNTSRAGDAYAARGAGAIVNAARLSFTLWSPSQDEALAVGIDPAKRFEYVRFDDAKMNFALQSGSPNWLRKHSVRLPAGDDVGVLVPHNMKAVTDAVTLSWAALIAAEMKGNARASCTLNEAADMLRAADHMSAKLAAGVLRARVKSALANPRQTTDGLVKFVSEMINGKMVDKIVLE